MTFVKPIMEKKRLELSKSKYAENIPVPELGELKTDADLEEEKKAEEEESKDGAPPAKKKKSKKKKKQNATGGGDQPALGETTERASKPSESAAAG